MFLLRLQCLVNNQPLLLKQVVVYLLDGVTPASLVTANHSAAAITGKSQDVYGAQ